jgi:hypothetical protein
MFVSSHPVTLKLRRDVPQERNDRTNLTFYGPFLSFGKIVLFGWALGKRHPTTFGSPSADVVD